MERDEVARTLKGITAVVVVVAATVMSMTAVPRAKALQGQPGRRPVGLGSAGRATPADWRTEPTLRGFDTLDTLDPLDPQIATDALDAIVADAIMVCTTPGVARNDDITKLCKDLVEGVATDGRFERRWAAAAAAAARVRARGTGAPGALTDTEDMRARIPAPPATPRLAPPPWAGRSDEK